MNKIRDGVSETGMVVEVDEIFIHPGYVNKYRYLSAFDIALLYLKSPVIWSKYIRPACLPQKCDSSYSFLSKTIDGCEQGTVAGWGFIGFNPNIVANLTMEISQELKPLKFCQDYFNTIGPNSTSQMCAINMDVKGGACQGDSGGPFNCRAIKGKDFIVGVVSWGHRKCNTMPDIETAPTIFTRICYALPWMKKTISEMEGSKTIEEMLTDKMGGIGESASYYSVDEFLDQKYLSDFKHFFRNFYCKREISRVIKKSKKAH